MSEEEKKTTENELTNEPVNQVAAGEIPDPVPDPPRPCPWCGTVNPPINKIFPNYHCSRCGATYWAS